MSNCNVCPRCGGIGSIIELGCVVRNYNVTTHEYYCTSCGHTFEIITMCTSK